MKKQVFDIGEYVACDLCNGDFTNSDEKGGFLFGSKGVCPRCTPRFMAEVIKYQEQRYIKAVCPPDMTFKEFSLRIRGGDNTVTICSLEKGENIKDLFNKKQ